MTVGQPFNPHGLFNGIFIPEALLKAKSLSLGAKVVYGRLTRYAGKSGLCYPAMGTLASEIGLEARQARRYISELEEFGLIRRVKRFSGEDNAQTSNGYEFLIHVIFADSFRVTGGPRSDTTAPPMTDTTAKESHVLRESRVNKKQHSKSFEAVGAESSLELPEEEKARMAAIDAKIKAAWESKKAKEASYGW